MDKPLISEILVNTNKLKTREDRIKYLHDQECTALKDVLRIAFDETGYEELEVWSFGHVTNADEYRYEDMTFGKAEGLTMDEDNVYVILDNNGLARVGDPTDHRPLLFVFARP